MGCPPRTITSLLRSLERSRPEATWRNREISPKAPAIEITSWPPATNGWGALVSSSFTSPWTSTLAEMVSQRLVLGSNRDAGCVGAAAAGGSAAGAVVAAGATTGVPGTAARWQGPAQS